MEAVSSQREPINLGPKSQLQTQSLSMATSASAAPGDERNGLELNGHVSPAESQPDANNTNNSSTQDDAPSQNQLKNTEVSNKDAFASNQSVSAMTPPSADPAGATDAPATADSADSDETKDTEMVDAPAESAKPPSPPAEPVAEEADAPSEKPADAAAAASSKDDLPGAENSVNDESTSNGENDKSDAAAAEPSPSGDIKGDTKAIDTQAIATSGAAPGDLVTPTVPMSQMALDASQEGAGQDSTQDTKMTDVPSQASSKVARERDEEDDEEPAAKRARTSGEGVSPTAQPEPAAPATVDAMAVDPPAEKAEQPADPAPTPAPAPASESKPAANGSPVPLSVDGQSRKLNDTALDNNPISVWQNREIRKVLGLVKKTKCGQHFRQPVQVLWPTVWDQYRQLIERPMDISLLEQNLRDGKYDTLGQFRRDVELLQANATTFNGANHDVTNWAKTTVLQINERLAAIPAEEPAKPVKQDVKQMPTRHAEPRHQPAPKKESRPSVSSPAVEKSNDSQIYALLPSGIPNIRRDSTKNDSDRPKRPIHPPKNKDIGFPPKTSKNKKKPELRFCEEVLKDITSNKNWVHNQWFMEPVDPVALNIPTYHSVVKQPMDLGTMKEKMLRGEYETAKDFKNDFGLIVKNCIKFNGEDHLVSNAAKELEKIFEKKWSEKSSWMSKHVETSAAAPASATSARSAVKEEEHEEEEASEVEPQEGLVAEIEETQRSINTLSSRLKQEREQLDKKLNSANPDKTDIDMHQGIINHLQSQMVDKRQALNKLMEAKKAPQPKAPKKKSTGGGAAAGAGAPKKTSGAQSTSKKAAGGGATAPKKAAAKKKLNEEEKEIVSEAIARLEGKPLDTAINIIKKDTGIKETDDDELELDMDQLSDDALIKLFDIVVKQFPAYKEQLKKYEPAAAPASHANNAKSAKPKKNKPMGKAEQERKLEQLRELKNSYKRPGSGSQEPLPSVEQTDANLPGPQHEDSDDASSSEEE